MQVLLLKLTHKLLMLWWYASKFDKIKCIVIQQAVNFLQSMTFSTKRSDPVPNHVTLQCVLVETRLTLLT